MSELSRTVVRRTLFYGLILLLHLLGLQRSNAVDGLKINQLRMPEPMENGTIPAVIVDCDYTYEESDMRDFVLKWFFNEALEPVYQWIPPRAPEATGVLTTKIDLEFRISEDNFTMHRALRILWPTVELAGKYRCQVSSLNGESEKEKDLVVYVPAAMVSINYTKPTQHTVNVTCLVTGMYPVPEAFILVHRGQDEEPERITDTIVSVESNVNGDGSYDTILYREFQDKRLSPNTSFECVFAIPAARYEATDRITYYPNVQSITATGQTTTTRSSMATPLLVTMSSIILCLRLQFS